MTDDGADRPVPIPIERLGTSYRFDGEMARLLTAHQYRADGIELSAATPTSTVPATAYDAPTTGIEAVLASDAPLVFITYGDRHARMVNPIETAITTAIVSALRPPATTTQESRCSVGCVTPHNAQRGALEQQLPQSVTVDTVERFQGDERDVMVLSSTVADPAFARRENRFLLDPRRLLVAISRSKRLTIVACSEALFEIVPRDPDRLDDGPVWARLFALCTGRNSTPTWSGTLGEFCQPPSEHDGVSLAVHPATPPESSFTRYTGGQWAAGGDP